MGDTVLVTGGAGYIGSHIVVELARVGHKPVVIDNFCNSSPAVVPRLSRITCRPIPCVEADVRDRAALAHLFAEHAVTAVVHCAGLKAVGESEAQPGRYYDNNVAGTIALVEAMAAADVKRLVFSSSAAVYGQPERNPVTEDAPLRPQSVYGRTKRIIEQLLEDLAAAERSWRIALLRYFNPAGAHPSAAIGEAPSEVPNNLVPLLADVAAGKRAEISVYGHDWPTPDGTGVRDYIHVMDLAEYHVAALAYLASAPGLIALNLGTGSGHSVLEVIAAFERACGRPIPQRDAPRRPGDTAAYYADPSRAAAVLGMRARHGLDTICADAWRWQLQRPGE
ncbi:MAG: UDP-glucose 4-epimerase GalE [Casimicrobiaceae bacterium]